MHTSIITCMRTSVINTGMRTSVINRSKPRLPIYWSAQLITFTQIKWCNEKLIFSSIILHCYATFINRYGSACISITSSKKAMNELPLPFLLCTSQFLIATIIVGFYSKYITKSYKKIPPSARVLVYQISLSYTFGFIFTNTAFSLGKHLLHHDFCVAIALWGRLLIWKKFACNPLLRSFSFSTIAQSFSDFFPSFFTESNYDEL